jgi:hypothetical protein
MIAGIILILISLVKLLLVIDATKIDINEIIIPIKDLKEDLIKGILFIIAADGILGLTCGFMLIYG